MTDEPQPVDEPVIPQPVVIECAICHDELRHPAQRWVHTNPPADGHKPVPVERASQ